MAVLIIAIVYAPVLLLQVATGTGSEVQRPLATAVSGGLVTASLVTFLALPALYVRFGGRPEGADGAEG